MPILTKIYLKQSYIKKSEYHLKHNDGRMDFSAIMYKTLGRKLVKFGMIIACQDEQVLTKDETRSEENGTVGFCLDDTFTILQYALPCLGASLGASLGANIGANLGAPRAYQIDNRQA